MSRDLLNITSLYSSNNKLINRSPQVFTGTLSSSLPLATGSRRVYARVFPGRSRLMSKQCVGWYAALPPRRGAFFFSFTCVMSMYLHLKIVLLYNCSSSLGKNAIFIFVQQVLLSWPCFVVFLFQTKYTLIDEQDIPLVENYAFEVSCRTEYTWSVFNTGCRH